MVLIHQLNRNQRPKCIHAGSIRGRRLKPGSSWVLIAALVCFLAAEDLAGQIPPVLGGPAIPPAGGTSKFRGHLPDLDDPKSRDLLWDERTAAYLRTLAMIRREAKELGRWFQPQNEKTARLLEDIIGQTAAMETALYWQSPEWAPWILSLKSERFLQQLSEVGYTLKDINNKIRPALDQVRGDPGSEPLARYASAGPIVPVRSQPTTVTNRIFQFIEDVQKDFQCKTNLDWLNVQVHSVQGLRHIYNYKVDCIWKVGDRIRELREKTPTHLKGTFRGSTTPTRITPFPAGVYTVYARHESEPDTKITPPGLGESNIISLRKPTTADVPAFPGSDIILKFEIH